MLHEVLEDDGCELGQGQRDCPGPSPTEGRPSAKATGKVNTSVYKNPGPGSWGSGERKGV